MIRHSICDICTPGPHCGLELTVENGAITGVRGTPDFPGSGGKLCVKGLATAQYVYRADRIPSPMRRTGPRGSGSFTPISWEEALDLTARQLARAKEAAGAQSVLFMTGYEKWLRPWLQRFAFQFGSPNFLTESSACNRAKVMAWKSMTGASFRPDLGRAALCLGWGYNPAGQQHVAYQALRDFKARGGKLILVDPRRCQAAEMADVYLQPRNGTDTALAFAIARELFSAGGVDEDFLRRHVQGAEEYRALVEPFTPERTQALTGVPAGDIRRAAAMLAEHRPACLQGGNSLTHRTGGFDLYRAVIALMALTGNLDRPGGMLPEQETFCHSNGGVPSREAEFSLRDRFHALPPAVGARRFPFRDRWEPEGQGMDLVHWLEGDGGYPLKAALCLGVNHMMYPQSSRFLAAMDELDFIAASDLFWTETCRHADVVFPALSSVERAEVKCYAGKYLYYTSPAIPPVVDGIDDVELLTRLAQRLLPEDGLLCGGYDAAVRYIMEPAGIADWDAVRAADGPVPVPSAAPYVPGSFLSRIPTPSGKVQLVCPEMAQYGRAELSPLPRWSPPERDPEFPFTGMAGARIPFAIHSRCHKVPQLRRLRPQPLVELCPGDAAALGIAEGDHVSITSPAGSITMTAHLHDGLLPGEISLYHGYEEANANELIPADLLDPYTGFPAYKQFPCRLTRVEE